jgi:hypothetical protein
MNFRGIQKEAVEKPFDFITSFTTNTPDLYGIIRSINPDIPLLSRIAIIEMLECKDQQELYEWTHNQFNPETQEFKYSFYKWLREEFIIPDDFTPNRYESKLHPEKVEFMNESKELKRSSIEQWFSGVIEDERTFEDATFSKIQYKTVLQSKINSSYKEYMSGSNKVCCEDNVIKFVVGLGFEEYRNRTGRYLRIKLPEFEKLVAKYRDTTPELEEDEGSRLW